MCCFSGITACGGGGSDLTDTRLDTPTTTSGPSAVTADVAGIELANAPEAVTDHPYATFSFSAEGAAGFECRLDDDYLGPCESPQVYLPLAAGDHTFLLSALDANGSVVEEVRHTWRVRGLFSADNAEPSHADLVPTAVLPVKADGNSWRGIFRINCDFAHSSYDDPIVFPGEQGAAHLHRFYGNTLVDAHSNLDSLFTSGDSSCQGNTLNRSAYWIPALLAPAYDAETGQRAFDESGEPAWQVVPAVVGDDDVAHEVFYYSAGVDDLTSIQTIPLGLKMIAGDVRGAPGNEQSTAVVRWHCQSWEANDANNPRWSTTIPECTAPDRVRMDIFFPSCWNGYDLDASDHKSHLAYPLRQGEAGPMVCPDTHPTPILRVSFHYAFAVKPDVYDPATRSSRGWRLVSDSYDTTGGDAGGLSLHGDWFNAWHPEALEAILSTCVQQGLDCHDGNLANGYRLSGTRPGTQEQPVVQGVGEGAHH